MRLKLISVRQVKCNFCHQWIQVQRYELNSLYTCSKCLEKYQAGGEVLTQNGHLYRILFWPDSHSSVYPSKDASTQEQLSLKNSDFGSWSQLHNVLGSSSFSQDQLQLIGSRISTINKEYEQEAQNILDLMKELSRCKSHVFESEKKEETINKSQLSLPKRLFQRETSEKQFNLNHIQTKIDNFCLKIKDNGFISPYNFYFQEEEIQRYKKGTDQDKPDRSFGTELTNISYDDLFLNFKRSQGLKSNRSARSNDQVPTGNLRLTDQQSKNRIDAYLQSRYHSTSLHRILARKIKEAYERTNLLSKMIELVSFNIGSIDLLCYLSLFEGQHMTTIKLINVGLRDEHLKQLLEWMGNKKVESLVLTGNKLTDQSLSLFLNRSLPFLREIYLGKNRIRKQRVKEDIVQIRSKFILYI